MAPVCADPPVVELSMLYESIAGEAREVVGEKARPPMTDWMLLMLALLDVLLRGVSVDGIAAKEAVVHRAAKEAVVDRAAKEAARFFNLATLAACFASSASAMTI